MGTTTSATKSFKQSYSVTVKTGAGLLGNGSEVGLSFGYTRNSGNSSALTIAKSGSTTIQDTGPSSDGIDHDRDMIYLWLNPTIALTVTSQSAAWTIDGSGMADIQYVCVGWLKHPDQMPPGLSQRLQHYGLTTQDYAIIMRQDSYADGSPAITSRYQALHTTFPYEPPYAEEDTPPTHNFTVTSSGTLTNSSSTESDYDVGLSIKASASFIAGALIEND